MNLNAGWYPDPMDASRRRWWDGSKWSHDTQVDDTVLASMPPPTPTKAPAEGERPRPGLSGSSDNLADFGRMVASGVQRLPVLAIYLLGISFVSIRFFSGSFAANLGFESEQEVVRLALQLGGGAAAFFVVVVIIGTIRERAWGLGALLASFVAYFFGDSLPVLILAVATVAIGLWQAIRFKTGRTMAAVGAVLAAISLALWIAVGTGYI